MANTLIITGGTGSIGSAIVQTFAAEGFQVMYNGTEATAQVTPELLNLPRTHYVRGDVADPATSLGLLSEAYRNFGHDLGRLVVVANAGMKAADTESPASVLAMQSTNVDGTRHLLETFAGKLSGHSDSLFVGVGPFYGIGVADRIGHIEHLSLENYLDTKIDVAKIMHSASERFPALNAITLTTGNILHEDGTDSMNGLLLRIIAQSMAYSDVVHDRLTEVVNEPLEGMNSADLFVDLLGGSLAENAAVLSLKQALVDDPTIEKQESVEAILHLSDDAATRQRMEELLISLGLLLTPETVADRLFAEVNQRRVASGGTLKVFQSADPSDDFIAKVLGPAFGDPIAAAISEYLETQLDLHESQIVEFLRPDRGHPAPTIGDILDSLALVELSIFLENTLDIHIPDDDELTAILPMTAEQLVAYLRKNVSERGSRTS